MLKLLKYEMIHSWRSFGIIYIIFLAACVLAPFLWDGGRMEFSNNAAMMAGTIAMMVIVLMTFAIILSTMVNIVLNYRNSMFRHPGYLTLTLPVSTHQLILSKVLADIIWLFVAGLVLAAGYSLMELIMGIIQGVQFPSLEDWIRLFSLFRIDFHDVVLLAESLVLMLVMLAHNILFLYFVITAVQTRYTPKHRTAISIALFFGILIVGGMVGDGIRSLLAPLNIQLNANGVLLCAIGIQLLLCALYYAGTWFVLEKKLEVE